MPNYQGFHIQVLHPADENTVRSVFEKAPNYFKETKKRLFTESDIELVLGTNKPNFNKYTFALLDGEDNAKGLLDILQDPSESTHFTIEWLVIAEDVVKEGLDELLEKVALQWAKDDGGKQFDITLPSSYDVGISFWKKLGYSILTETEENITLSKVL